MRIIEEPKLDFSDVIILPKRSSLESRSEVELIKEYTFLHGSQVYRGIPVLASNMSHTGTIEMANALQTYYTSAVLHKHYDVDVLIDYFNTRFADAQGGTPVFYSMGISTPDYEKFKAVKEKTCDNLGFVCVDVANGYSEPFAGFIQKLRHDFPSIVIMAGNVVTAEMTEQLLLSGADIVKVGIGNGSVCTTRKIAGVGCPQFSAIVECADAAHGLKGHVCADGGCQMPGDVAKAFGAGADFVMLGGMMAGHDECDGEKVYPRPNGTAAYPITMEDAECLGYNVFINQKDDKIYRQLGDGSWKSMDAQLQPSHMKFYGMSSKQAMAKYSGGVADYRASEGKEVLVPYRGSVSGTIREVLGGIRSACTYTGSKTLKELPKRTTFVKVHRTHNTVFGDE